RFQLIFADGGVIVRPPVLRARPDWIEMVTDELVAEDQLAVAGASELPGEDGEVLRINVAVTIGVAIAAIARVAKMRRQHGQILPIDDSISIEVRRWRCDRKQTTAGQRLEHPACIFG